MAKEMGSEGKHLAGSPEKCPKTCYSFCKWMMLLPPLLSLASVPPVRCQSFSHFMDILRLALLRHQHREAALQKHFQGTDSQCVSMQFTLQHPSCTLKASLQLCCSAQRVLTTQIPLETSPSTVSNTGSCHNAFHSIHIQHSS